MTRAELRSRVGVASLTPELLPLAFEKLPIGFYKDYHAMGGAHGEYVPVIQYKGKDDTPEFREMLRRMWTTDFFPRPVGVTLDEMLTMTEASALEEWFVQSATAGTLRADTLFMLGNEPGYRPNFDTRTPEQVVEDAVLVREIWEREGLGYRLALGGISTAETAYNEQAYGTTGLAFFEGVLAEAEGRDVAFDAFVIHPYPMRGAEVDASDPSVLMEDSIHQVRAFRSIMLRHGQADRDLIVGEVGLPFPLDSGLADPVLAYADQFLTWCLLARDEVIGNPRDGNRLIQRVVWYVLAAPTTPLPGFTNNPGLDLDRSALLDAEGGLTALGTTLNAVADRIAPRR